MKLNEIKTPSLIIDKQILVKNCNYMSNRMRKLGVDLRPHLKTAKSFEIAKIATNGHFGGITVSTLAEASYFLENGIKDITYAVGISPDKLEEVNDLLDKGARVRVITDNLAVVPVLQEKCASLKANLNVLIEIDTGGLRGGINPESEELIDLAKAIEESNNLNLDGVLTHAGHSYECDNIDSIRLVADNERSGVVRAAEILRKQGISCDVVSAGSTPTAVFAENLDGITEMRPGAYMFFDLDQVGMGVCKIDDIAVTVLATVIGHKKDPQRLLIDAGSLALSKDLSANQFMDNVGYGIVCMADNCSVIPGLYVERTYQEHGLIASINGPIEFDSFPIGTKVRILPNHTCITSAAHDKYYVLDNNTVIETWDRVNGW